MTTFQLSKKKGNEHWIKPVIDRESNTISWIVQTHDEGIPKHTVSRTAMVRIAVDAELLSNYLCPRTGESGQIKEIMTAIVAEGNRRKLFLSPTDVHIQVAQSVEPMWRPRGELPNQALGFRVQSYGITQWHQLFTERQLTMLTVFSDLLSEVSSIYGRCV